MTRVEPDPALPVEVVALRVQDDGTARGRCVGPSPFMPLRSQQVSARGVEEAEERWEAAGKPEPTRLGVTVTSDGQRIWLDSPTNAMP
ncbi:hypothetical protein [Actinomadura roseirufa]|uniref:hypothetical protein n=1 Tax=Actinomadura roseirufa TaxID=2094049 RepID=UPI0010415A46|nr:hypothetical protein [Actinomadura roseirufa]